MKSQSATERWLPTSSAGPSAGTFCRPVIRGRPVSRRNGPMRTYLSSQYNIAVTAPCGGVGRTQRMLPGLSGGSGRDEVRGPQVGIGGEPDHHDTAVVVVCRVDERAPREQSRQGQGCPDAVELESEPSAVDRDRRGGGGPAPRARRGSRRGRPPRPPGRPRRGPGPPAPRSGVAWHRRRRPRPCRRGRPRHRMRAGTAGAPRAAWRPPGRRPPSTRTARGRATAIRRTRRVRRQRRSCAPPARSPSSSTTTRSQACAGGGPARVLPSQHRRQDPVTAQRERGQHLVVGVDGAGDERGEAGRRVVGTDLDRPVVPGIEASVHGARVAGQHQCGPAVVPDDVRDRGRSAVEVPSEDHDDAGPAHEDSARRLSSRSAPARIRRSARLRSRPITGTTSSISNR